MEVSNNSLILVSALVNIVFISSVLAKDGTPELNEHGCTVNQTYVFCHFDCPTDHCPGDDDPQPVCDAPLPQYCKPGCRCRLNYRINREGHCNLASECPPINCTRPNEVYNSCPEECRNEQCEARNDSPVICNTLLLNCQPKCVCRKGTWRNSKDICVEACNCDT